jgi:hypothetical protein
MFELLVRTPIAQAHKDFSVEAEQIQRLISRRQVSSRQPNLRNAKRRKFSENLMERSLLPRLCGSLNPWLDWSCEG